MSLEERHEIIKATINKIASELNFDEPIRETAHEFFEAIKDDKIANTSVIQPTRVAGAITIVAARYHGVMPSVRQIARVARGSAGFIISLTYDIVSRLVDAYAEKDVEKACTIVGRTLAQDEWIHNAIVRAYEIVRSTEPLDKEPPSYAVKLAALYVLTACRRVPLSLAITMLRLDYDRAVEGITVVDDAINKNAPDLREECGKYVGIVGRRA